MTWLILARWLIVSTSASFVYICRFSLSLYLLQFHWVFINLLFRDGVSRFGRTLLREDLQTFRSVLSHFYPALSVVDISISFSGFSETAASPRHFICASYYLSQTSLLIPLSRLFKNYFCRFSSDEMWRLSGDFLQGSYNICKSQMHVILQKGNRRAIKC